MTPHATIPQAKIPQAKIPQAKIKEAIVLAGGFGTRLRSVVSDLPKPLAPVAGKPFLHFLLDGLARQGIECTVLAVHHMADRVRSAIGDRHGAMEIRYALEDRPMGTGGAIAQALALTSGERVAVLNGDTYLPVDLTAMADAMGDAALAMAVVAVDRTNRFGSVKVFDGNVTGFVEKSASAGAGWINGGVYLVRRDLPAWQRHDAFSMERDVLEPGGMRIAAFPVPGPFLDIGTPEDYGRAQHLLPAWQETA